MNGILAGTPNSNRSVATEVARRFAQEMSIGISEQLSSIDLANIPSNIKAFVSTTDDGDYRVPFPLSYLVLSRLQHSFEDRFECQMMLDQGEVEDWPMELKHPCKRNVRINSTFKTELRAFFNGSDITYIRPRIDKFGRCIVNGINYSSDFNSTDRGSVVKSMFVDTTNELAPYIGVVRFYFTVTTVIMQQAKVHHLALCSWLKFRPHSQEHVCKLHGVTNQVYRGDRILVSELAK